jgi:hypothetical protein
MKKEHIKTNILKLYTAFRKIRYAKQGAKIFPGNLAQYLETLKPRFDISALDAVNLILADKTLSPAEKQEDIKFLKCIQDNLPASLGALDVKRVKRLERAAQRADLASQRFLKEEERKKV